MPRKTLRLQPPEPELERDSVEFLVDGEVVEYRLKQVIEIGFEDLAEIEQLQQSLTQLIQADNDAEITVASDVVSRLMDIVFYDALPPEAMTGLTVARIEALGEFMQECWQNAAA